ncbi:MAG: type IV secretory system conjugative DNA transfer family protein [Acidobacteriia bacterium]|nr:type IV secretory system conjugative DNA transfer family protein [Terriglobia bacterium]
MIFDAVCKGLYWLILGVFGAILLGFVGVISFFAGPFGIAIWGFVGFCIKLYIEGNKETERWQKKQREQANTFNPVPIHLSAHFATDAELEAAGCFRGGIPLGYSQESGREISTPQAVHRSTFGSTGSGKSTTAIINEILTAGDEVSLIIPDSTGEITATTADYRAQVSNTVIVNPQGVFLDELGDLPQGGFNILSPKWIDPNDEYNFAIRAQKAANAIVRRDPNLRDPYWADTCRQLTTNAIMTECQYSPNPSIVNVANVMLRDITGYARDMMNTGDPWLVKLWGRWGRPGAEEIKSLNEVQENARTEFWPYTMIPPVAECLSKDDIDFREAVYRPMTIYIVGKMETVKETGRLLRLATAHATAQIMSVAGQGRLRAKLIIDELFQIGQIDDLDSNLAANRKYGLDLFLCLNDHQQLKDLFPQTFDSVINSCGIRQWINAPDPTTSEYLSSLCGEREVITISRTVNDNQGKLGVGDGKQVSTRRLILPHEVRSLGPREQILWVPGVLNPVRCNRKAYFDIPELCQRAKPNPFYSRKRA